MEACIPNMNRTTSVGNRASMQGLMLASSGCGASELVKWDVCAPSAAPAWR